MTPRLKRQMDHLRLLLNIRKNWDFYTSRNDGFFTNKVSLQTWGSRLIMTRQELEKHIERTKSNIRKSLR